MKKIEIVHIDSLSRAPLHIEGYLFKGSQPSAPSVAIIGAMEGNTIIPLYTASKLVDFMKNHMAHSQKILGDILIIPSLNHYALNLNERYWPLDHTDINMMFPGYEQGETTQRIAKKVFDVLQDYTHGIILETRKDLATCIPYVKLFKSGYEDRGASKKFGFRLIYHKELEPTDIVSLQYNWQLWGTKAYSIVCPNETKIDCLKADSVFEGIISFLSKNKIIDYKILSGYQSTVAKKSDIEVIKTPKSGIFVPIKNVGSFASKDEMIGTVIDALEGNIIHHIVSPTDGLIACQYKNALIFENAVAYRIVKSG
ncbi:M14 family metallopeptidase [Sulfurospirillum sp. 1612]|uniref:M14 family metallopeptidase n=1 Tax=Sulfurospirillum sp. 1612 TaxID=3094835 RepID=UPI002F95EAF4